MIDITSSIICNARVRSVIYREPVLCGMTSSAIEAEHAGMEGRIAMTICTGYGQPCKLACGMALFTCQSGMASGQREIAQVMKAV